MYVIKRDGKREEVSFDKILVRLRNLCRENPPLDQVAYPKLTQMVISDLYNGVTTTELDNYAACKAAALSHLSPQYNILAARLAITSHRANCIYNLMHHYLYLLKIEKTGFSAEEEKAFRADPRAYVVRRGFYLTCRALYPLISPRVMKFVETHPEVEEWILYDNDNKYDYLGYSLLEQKYLYKGKLYDLEGNLKEVVIERPQHMLMRVAIALQVEGKYRNQDKARYNHQALWDMVKDEFKKTIHRHSYAALERRVQKGKIDWKEVKTLARHHLRPDLVKIITQGMKVKSWEEVLQETVVNADVEAIKESYWVSSEKYLSRATPTLYNLGSLKPQGSSCYIMQTPYDSMNSISNNWQNAAKLSKHAGGIAMTINNIRPSGAYISGTNGHSNGVVPMLRVYNNISVYVDQGGGKRPGSCAMYIPPWSGEIESVIEMRDPQGPPKQIAPELFYGFWACDEFFRRLKKESDDKLWYLMDPNVCHKLLTSHDEKLVVDWIEDEEVSKEEMRFTYYYRKYIRKGKYLRAISARSLYANLLDKIIELGIPYVCCGDAGNRKSNHKNLGIIASSNLCTEIFQYYGPDEIAVCNLVSLCLPRFVVDAKGPGSFTYDTNVKGVGGAYWRTIDWTTLEKVIRLAVRDANRVIDINFYPLVNAREGNRRHRPIGIGVQGLADLYSALRIPYDSAEADQLEFYVFEAILYYALDESCRLAQERREMKLKAGKVEKYEATTSGAYATFAGSPFSQGIFQPDMWVSEQAGLGWNPLKYHLSKDWEGLRLKVMTSGTRNSQLISLMPTASSSDINGFSAGAEPHNSMIYKRKNGNSEYLIINHYMIEDLQALGLWKPEVIEKIQQSRTGSIAEIEQIPQRVRDIYRCAWDIGIRRSIDRSLTRAVFIDQAESFNIFSANMTNDALFKAHIYSWQRGKKTFSYYCRGLAAVDAQKVGTIRDLDEYLVDSCSGGACSG